MLGYVVVPVLTPEECARVHDDLRQLRDTLLAQQPEPGSFAELGSGSGDNPNFGRVRHNGAYMGGSAAKTNLMNLIEVGGSVTGYAAHPRMVAMAEELIGAVRMALRQPHRHASCDSPGGSRLLRGCPGRRRASWSTTRYSTGASRTSTRTRRRSTAGTAAPRQATFPLPHSPLALSQARIVSAGEASHERGELIHCNFVKTLTNLTELGPDDGGTCLIAGSHRMPLPPHELIQLAEEDPSLIHQVVAPPGSALLFGETL